MEKLNVVVTKRKKNRCPKCKIGGNLGRRKKARRKMTAQGKRRGETGGEKKKKRVKRIRENK